MTLLDQPAAIDLTMVVPFFNPGATLRPTVDALLATLDSTSLSFEIICVSDGSTDASEASLDGLPSASVRLLRSWSNHGKGHALRAGLSEGRGRYVGFIDADGDLPPWQLTRFTSVFTQIRPFQPGERRAAPEGADFILGTKIHPDAANESSRARRLASRGWHHLVEAAFHLHVSDTQVGLKLLRREMLRSVLPVTREEGFAFDLELLVVARNQGYRRHVEIPVTLEERSISTVTGRTALTMAIDAVRIWCRLHLTESYGPRRQSPEPRHVVAAPPGTPGDSPHAIDRDRRTEGTT